MNKAQLVRLLTRRNLGLADWEESNIKEAEKAFAELAARAPSEPLPYANLGLAHLRNGALAQTEAEIIKALALSPDDTDILLIPAEILHMSGKEAEAIATLAASLRRNPKHVRSLYKIVQFYSRQPERASRWQKMEEALAKIVAEVPANLPVRLTYIEALLHNDKPGEALAQMEELRKQLPELPEDTEAFFEAALTAMRALNAREALAPATIFHNILKPTPLYTAGVRELNGPGGALSGFPLLHFSSSLSAQIRREKTVLAAMCFTDVTASTGLNTIMKKSERRIAQAFASNLALGDYDSDGDVDLFVIDATGADHLLRNDHGRFIEVAFDAVMKRTGRSTAATFADYDNDGDLDLYVVKDGPNALYQIKARENFSTSLQRQAWPIRRQVLRRSLRTSITTAILTCFSPMMQPIVFIVIMPTALSRSVLKAWASRERLAAATRRSGILRKMAISTFFVVNHSGNYLYTNLRQGRFQNIATASGLQSEAGAAVVVGGDYDNNGFVDLFTMLPFGGGHLYRNKEDCAFEKDTRTPMIQKNLQGNRGSDAAFFDFDNDGGNATHWLKLKSVGLAAGNCKNKRTDIGARLEMKAGDLFQMRVVTEPISRFGLEERASAEVIRVMWSNGMPQNRFHLVATKPWSRSKFSKAHVPLFIHGLAVAICLPPTSHGRAPRNAVGFHGR